MDIIENKCRPHLNSRHDDVYSLKYLLKTIESVFGVYIAPYRLTRTNLCGIAKSLNKLKNVTISSNEINLAKKEIESLRLQLKNELAVSTPNKKEISILKQDILHGKNYIKQLEDKNEKTLKETNDLRSELENKKNEMKELEQKLNDRNINKEDILKIKNEYETCKSDIKSIKEELSNEKQNNIKLSNKLTDELKDKISLKKQLEDIISQGNLSINKMTNIQTEYETCKSDIKSIREELAREKQTNGKLLSDLDSLTIQLNEKNKEKKEIEGRINNIMTNTQISEQDILKLKIEYETCNLEIKQVKDELIREKQNVDTVTKSKYELVEVNNGLKLANDELKKMNSELKISMEIEREIEKKVDEIVIRNDRDEITKVNKQYTQCIEKSNLLRSEIESLKKEIELLKIDKKELFITTKSLSDENISLKKNIQSCSEKDQLLLSKNTKILLSIISNIDTRVKKLIKVEKDSIKNTKVKKRFEEHIKQYDELNNRLGIDKGKYENIKCNPGIVDEIIIELDKYKHDYDDVEEDYEDIIGGISRTYLRIRNENNKSSTNSFAEVLDENTIKLNDTPTCNVVIKNMKFTHVFPSDVSNNEVFLSIEPLINNALMKNYNLLFSFYGQSGSGKSYNTKLLLDKILSKLKEKGKSIKIASLQLFNGRLIDTFKLNEIEPITKIDDESKFTSIPEKAFIHNPGNTTWKNEGEGEGNFINFIEKRRPTRHTLLNKSSSRSHSFIMLKVDNSIISFLDMAGSEKILESKTGSAAYLEGKYIINSLADFTTIFQKYKEGRKIDLVGLQSGIAMFSIIDYILNINSKDSVSKSIVFFTMRGFFTGNEKIDEIICSTTNSTLKTAAKLS